VRASDAYGDWEELYADTSCGSTDFPADALADFERRSA
jgi:hypothetical protein